MAMVKPAAVANPFIVLQHIVSVLHVGDRNPENRTVGGDEGRYTPSA